MASPIIEHEASLPSNVAGLVIPLLPALLPVAVQAAPVENLTVYLWALLPMPSPLLGLPITRRRSPPPSSSPESPLGYFTSWLALVSGCILATGELFGSRFRSEPRSSKEAVRWVWAGVLHRQSKALAQLLDRLSLAVSLPSRETRRCSDLWLDCEIAWGNQAVKKLSPTDTSGPRRSAHAACCSRYRQGLQETRQSIRFLSSNLSIYGDVRIYAGDGRLLDGSQTRPHASCMMQGSESRFSREDSHFQREESLPVAGALREPPIDLRQRAARWFTPMGPQKQRRGRSAGGMTRVLPNPHVRRHLCLELDAVVAPPGSGAAVSLPTARPSGVLGSLKRGLLRCQTAGCS